MVETHLVYQKLSGKPSNIECQHMPTIFLYKNGLILQKCSRAFVRKNKTHDRTTVYRKNQWWKTCGSVSFSTHLTKNEEQWQEWNIIILIKTVEPWCSSVLVFFFVRKVKKHARKNKHIRGNRGNIEDGLYTIHKNGGIGDGSSSGLIWRNIHISDVYCLLLFVYCGVLSLVFWIIWHQLSAHFEINIYIYTHIDTYTYIYIYIYIYIYLHT